MIRRIVVENSSCFMLKHEDWPGLDKISALRGFERYGSMRSISILCGNGGLFLDFELERGADGANTGYAFPDMLVDVVWRASIRAPARCRAARPPERPPDQGPSDPRVAALNAALTS